MATERPQIRTVDELKPRENFPPTASRRVAGVGSDSGEGITGATRRTRGRDGRSSPGRGGSVCGATGGRSGAAGSVQAQAAGVRVGGEGVEDGKARRWGAEGRREVRRINGSHLPTCH
jgi:hypothetical protein